MKDFLIQNLRVLSALLCGVLGVILATSDVWNYAGVLVAAATLFTFVSFSITAITLDFTERERNWVAGAFAVAGTCCGIGSIALRHPSFEECTVKTQRTLERLGQEAHLNPVGYDLDAPQVQLAQNMYLACAVQGARDLATVPGDVFQAQQAPEISVPTRVINGSGQRPANQCLEAYNKLQAAKPSLFKLYKDELACLGIKPSRLSW